MKVIIIIIIIKVGQNGSVGIIKLHRSVLYFFLSMPTSFHLLMV